MPLNIAESFSYPMGPCWVSTSSQSYPLCASCSATVGLWALRNRPILGVPARSCFLNSDPLSAASGIGNSSSEGIEKCIVRDRARALNTLISWRSYDRRTSTANAGIVSVNRPDWRFARARNETNVTTAIALGVECGCSMDYGPDRARDLRQRAEERVDRGAGDRVHQRDHRIRVENYYVPFNASYPRIILVRHQCPHAGVRFGTAGAGISGARVSGGVHRRDRAQPAEYVD